MSDKVCTVPQRASTLRHVKAKSSSSYRLPEETRKAIATLPAVDSSMSEERIKDLLEDYSVLCGFNRVLRGLKQDRFRFILVADHPTRLLRVLATLAKIKRIRVYATGLSSRTLGNLVSLSSCSAIGVPK